QRAGRLLSAFIDDMSNWYVRRSRRRFWDGDPAALASLHEALRITTLCLAPFTPFIAERVWQDLFRDSEPADWTSVHLAAWPTVDVTLIDERLESDVQLVRRIVELGRAARASSSVKTRQPLSRALVAAGGWSGLSDELREQISDELNVLRVDDLGETDSGFVDVAIKANFRSLGGKFGKQTPDVAAAIAASDPVGLLSDIRADGGAVLTVPALGDVRIEESDLVVTETPREGWAVAAEGGESIALDLALTDELRRAGLAREVVRGIQEARKQAGFEVADRIHLWWSARSAHASQALAEYADRIADEVLATQIVEVPEDVAGPGAPAIEVDLAEFGLRAWIART
ncbi:MAG: class I tRNA ligase family protein, partial [Actinomycetales bacterium]|nr:class I tRNA ligase family protein [Actinomycetales bacterium]